MSRQELIKGTIVSLDRQYTIDSVLGCGATCIVYEAYYKDSNCLKHKVNIKECYPYGAKVIRDGTCLIWVDINEKEFHLNEFSETYNKMIGFQKENETVDAFDIYDTNNTKYVVMSSNKKSISFDIYKPENLCNLLRTIKALTRVVGKYHNEGYLHLDIKPCNFLVYPESPEQISLFDFDTVTPISDIKSNKCQGVSFSEKWAAPEQKQCKINKLCPATDIFAIGAVLFEKIMDKQVNNDDIGYFAEWEFKGELFEKVNPFQYKYP